MSEENFNDEEVLVKRYEKVSLAEVPVSRQEYDRELGEKKLDMLTIENRISREFMGQVLTLIDASIADPVQRKALKDVLRRDFDEMMDDLYALAELRG